MKNDKGLWLINMAYINKMLKNKKQFGTWLPLGNGCFRFGDFFDAKFVLNELSKNDSDPFYSDFVEKNKKVSGKVRGMDMQNMEFIWL